ncbi:MAG: Crp/Fnr family transcriptional regulator [Phenylobacterium sp.]
MTNIFVRKLSNLAAFSAAEAEALASASSEVREFSAGQQILSEGAIPRVAHAVMEGFACRYKDLPDGKRQIVDFVLPGDLCDGHMMFMAAMDHSIGCLSPCRVSCIAHADLLRLTEQYPRIARALWWSALVQESIAREWLVNLGRRPADQRIGHLLCELCFRLEAVGLVQGQDYQLPIRQLDLADATGLTPVHTNRVLQALRRRGLIALQGSTLTVQSLRELEAFSGFENGYLHPVARRA